MVVLVMNKSGHEPLGGSDQASPGAALISRPGPLARGASARMHHTPRRAQHFQNEARQSLAAD
jgi:hypothetical protein